MAERSFGPYRLVQQLAVGGMAEIYLAKTRGIGGFEKFIALKVIHPNFAEDEHFIKMLIDEAKIAVQLQHVNIAQIFDLGRIGQTYYIAMEFVDGSDLFRTLRRASEIDVDMPIELAAFVGQEVCAALDYAHNKRDDFGTPLGIIHRDVSPQNVLISHAGEVKLVDFGIAKAAQRLQKTAAGVIKGKYYYMSPEQAWGDPIDHRTDVFSTGILLYEMLVGQMLYLEEDLTVLLDKVRKAEIAPPSTLRKDIPRELEVIVMKALARKPEQRFQSAHELGAALERFLFGYAPDVSAARLSGFLDRVLGDDRDRFSAMLGPRGATREVISRADYEPDREHSVLFKPADLKPKPGSPRPAAAPSPRPRNQPTRQASIYTGGGSPPPRPAKPAGAPPPTGVSDFDENDGTQISGPPEGMPAVPPPLDSGLHDPGDGPTEIVDLSRTPAQPRPRLPGIGVPSGRPQPSRPPGPARQAAAAAARIAARPAPAPAPMPRKTTLNEAELFREAEPSPDLPRSEATDATTSPHVGKSQSIPRPVEVDHPPPRPEAGPPALPLPTDSIVRPLEPGVMRLSSTFGQPTADSSTVIPSPPALQPVFTLPPRKSHRTLVIGGAVVAASIAAAVMLSHGSSPPPPTRGNIQILSVPQGASVRFDGQPVAQTTPVTVPDIDRNRPHDVEVSLPGYQTKRQRVEIGEDVIVVLQRDVGTLDVRSEPAGAELYVDGKPAGTTPTTVRDLPLGSDVSLELRLRGYRAYREVLQWNGQRALARQITLKRSR